MTDMGSVVEALKLLVEWSEIEEESAIQEALSLPQVRKWVGDKEVKKRIYVPGKLVNLVQA